MEIQFLGTGDAFGSGGRLQTCFHVTTPEANFLIDCGATALIGMRRYDVDPISIEAIFLTHLHGDHFAGIPFFLLDAQLVSKRVEPLLIYGPPGTETRINQALDLMFPGSTQIQWRFSWAIIELNAREVAFCGDVQVRPFEVVHASGAPAYAFRLTANDKVVAFSGDTEWVPVLSDVARNADLFICECYTIDRPLKYHIDLLSLKTASPALEVARVLVTHMSKEALAYPDMPFERAEDGFLICV